MKKILSLFLLCGTALTAGAQGVYQIGNSDFETEWSDNNEPGSGWYGFVSAGGNLSNMKNISKGTLSKVTGAEAHGGSGTSVLLQSKNIASIAKANGNMTTGQINMGSSKPADQSNYNHTARGSYATQLAGLPDSLAYYGKFTRGTGGDGEYTGRCNAVIHGDIDYMDPYETDANVAAYKVAGATVYSTVTDEWTRYVGAFDYTGVTSDVVYILASFTTNETPGASKNDKFYIDDIELIYNSELTSFTYDGTSHTAADDLSAVAYDATKLGDIVTNGRGATTETSYDATSGVLTITVKGNDYEVNAENVHTYTVQFQKPEPTAISAVAAEAATDAPAYDLRGVRVAKGTKALPKGVYVVGGKKVVK